MRLVMRVESNDAYWDRRWREAGRDADSFDDLGVYPIRFAELVMRDHGAAVLEIGCGLGRVLKHYRTQGVAVTGLERSGVAVAQLREEDPSLNVLAGDVCAMPFADESFDVALAFGVYHNLERGMNEALAETARCLKPGGRFCISMRPDNIEMRLNEWYWRWQRRRSGGTQIAAPAFHKWLVTVREFKVMLEAHGLETAEVHTARNMSLLYRVPMFRARQECETTRRAQGYRLNAVGRAIDAVTTMVLPGQRANVLVFIGAKAESARNRGQRNEWSLVGQGEIRTERELELAEARS